MVKSMYDYVGDKWKKPDTSFKSPQKNRMIQWRREENFLKVDKPLRVDRARSLGYKAKQGYIIVRGRVRHGGLNRHQIKEGENPLPVEQRNSPQRRTHNESPRNEQLHDSRTWKY